MIKCQTQDLCDRTSHLSAPNLQLQAGGVLSSTRLLAQSHFLMQLIELRYSDTLKDKHELVGAFFYYC